MSRPDPLTVAAVLARLEEISRSRPDRVLRLRGRLPLDGAEEPLFALDRETDRDRTRAREMGLDEGAALIWEGASSSPQRGRDARLEGLVFTNVESRMRIADRTRPAPLLLLMRETDGE